MNVPAETQKKPLTLADRVERSKAEFAKALPGHIPVDKFVRTIKTALAMNPDLEAVGTTPEGIKSLMTACTKAATDGLIIDNREAALLVFSSKVKGQNGDQWVKAAQYIPMVAGLMKKVRNSGDIAAFNPPQIVYEKDKFSFNPSVDEVPDHAPDWFGDRGEAIGVYAVCKLKDGTYVVEVMSKQQVLRIGAQSKNAAQYDPKNGKNFEEWWRKTAIRRISKYLPSSSDKDEFMQAVSRIDETFDYEDQPAPEQAPAGKKRGAGAAALKNVTPSSPKETEIEQDNQPAYDQETGEIYEGEIVDGDEGRQAGDDI